MAKVKAVDKPKKKLAKIIKVTLRAEYGEKVEGTVHKSYGCGVEYTYSVSEDDEEQALWRDPEHLDKARRGLSEIIKESIHQEQIGDGVRLEDEGADEEEEEEEEAEEKPAKAAKGKKGKAKEEEEEAEEEEEDEEEEEEEWEDDEEDEDEEEEEEDEGEEEEEEDEGDDS